MSRSPGCLAVNRNLNSQSEGGIKMFDPDDDELFEEGWMNGHDVYRDQDDGGIWYDGYYCADASDYEEAEMEYWNTH